MQNIKKKGAQAPKKKEGYFHCERGLISTSKIKLIYVEREGTSYSE
ncbi:hypothetical protein UYSO10_3170 [Kosakonia radicincitans]|nr:hypothetical protein UYSO10_3170 [Kosakonia radicincitans]